MKRLVDSHAHLDSGRFNTDRDQAIERALRAGLVAILNVGADPASSRVAIALAEQFEFIYAAVGIHPHNAELTTPAALAEFREWARHPKVVAIGEIGLDYYRDLSPRPVQRQAFADQLTLAADLGLSVVIHSRDAYADVLAALQGWHGSGVIHCYSGGPENMDQIMAMGFSIGITGTVTQPKADRLREVVAKVPLERLLVETDCPYLTPRPYKGRNEPAYVRSVAETVARVRGVPAETVAQAATDNFGRLFEISLTEE